MPIDLDESFNEKSSGIIEIYWEDADDTRVTPTAASWTLTDLQGRVVNGRSSVSLSVALTVPIVLSAADTTFLSGESESASRIITVVSTYNSATYGSNLQLKEEGYFYIKGLQNVS